MTNQNSELPNWKQMARAIRSECIDVEAMSKTVHTVMRELSSRITLLHPLICENLKYRRAVRKMQSAINWDLEIILQRLGGEV